MSRLLLAAIFIVSLGASAQAHGPRGPEKQRLQPKAGGPAPIVLYEPDPIQGVGCYWARQRQICARYCYWQPDGRRYCVSRERQARREHVPYMPAVPFSDRPMK